MTGAYLFVHSPLVGPATWAPTAAEMARRGAEVAVPDLTVIAHAPDPAWQDFIDRVVDAARELREPIVVVGHSGAGAYLPAAGGALGDELGALVFVDAVVPPDRGAHVTPAAVQRLLDGHTVDGRLRPWLEWWPPDVVEELLPDPAERDALRAELPRLPRTLYDQPVAVPDGWSSGPCAYLQLSDGYRDEYAEAGRRGWPRAELEADHLAIRTQPEPVADALESLVAIVD